MRTTCLYCEQEGRTTTLVQTSRGGLCPIHSADFLAALDRQAKAHLGIPLSIPPQGRPAPRPM